MDASLGFDIRDGLLCLAFLAGAGVAAYARLRRQTRAAALAVAGFVLLGLNPLAEFIVFRVFRSAANINLLNWVYICISTPVALLGVAALIAAVWLAAHPSAPA